MSPEAVGSTVEGLGPRQALPPRLVEYRVGALAPSCHVLQGELLGQKLLHAQNVAGAGGAAAPYQGADDVHLGFHVRVERVELVPGEPDARLGGARGEVGDEDHGGGLGEGDRLAAGLHGWRKKGRLAEEKGNGSAAECAAQGKSRFVARGEGSRCDGGADETNIM